MYETERTNQIAMEMRRYDLVLEVSETHWTQAGQKRLDLGEMLWLSHSERCFNAVRRSTKCTYRMEISRIQDHQIILQNKEEGNHNKYYPILCTY
ncbi:unnamed protein product [Schistosoma margrebowiei]|uniref:Uncharacterized protein n=1 Tax=Schistosoma margrebowiei TaxID=48269 RepID=A0A183MI22_9TREM|nr:unnamed protein product [Schistosoma margrebowiei]